MLKIPVDNARQFTSQRNHVFQLKGVDSGKMFREGSFFKTLTYPLREVIGILQNMISREILAGVVEEALIAYFVYYSPEITKP